MKVMELYPKLCRPHVRSGSCVTSSATSIGVRNWTRDAELKPLARSRESASEPSWKCRKRIDDANPEIRSAGFQGLMGKVPTRSGHELALGRAGTSHGTPLLQTMWSEV